MKNLVLVCAALLLPSCLWTTAEAQCGGGGFVPGGFVQSAPIGFGGAPSRTFTDSAGNVFEQDAFGNVRYRGNLFGFSQQQLVSPFVVSPFVANTGVAVNIQNRRAGLFGLRRRQNVQVIAPGVALNINNFRR